MFLRGVRDTSAGSVREERVGMNGRHSCAALLGGTPVFAGTYPCGFRFHGKEWKGGRRSCAWNLTMNVMLWVVAEWVEITRVGGTKLRTCSFSVSERPVAAAHAKRLPSRNVAVIPNPACCQGMCDLRSTPLENVGTRCEKYFVLRAWRATKQNYRSFPFAVLDPRHSQVR